MKTGNFCGIFLEDISEFPKLVIQLAKEESPQGASQFGPIAVFSKFVAQTIVDDIRGTLIYLVGTIIYFCDMPEQSMIEPTLEQPKDEKSQANEEKGWTPSVLDFVECVQARIKGSLEQPDNIRGTIAYLDDAPEQPKIEPTLEEPKDEAKEEKGCLSDVMGCVERVQELVKGSLEQPKDEKSLLSKFKNNSRANQRRETTLLRTRLPIKRRKKTLAMRMTSKYNEGVTMWYWIWDSKKHYLLRA